MIVTPARRLRKVSFWNMKVVYTKEHERYRSLVLSCTDINNKKINMKLGLVSRVVVSLPLCLLGN